MKKATTKGSHAASSNGIESEIREALRVFARGTLDTEKLKDAAAKKIGGKPSYVRAMLKQRDIGGMNSWIPLMAYCFELRGLDLVKELERVLSDPAALSAGGGLSPSEQRFRALDKIPIVNEDVKFQLVNSLEMMLKDLEKSLDSQRKKR